MATELSEQLESGFDVADLPLDVFEIPESGLTLGSLTEGHGLTPWASSSGICDGACASASCCGSCIPKPL